TSISLDGNGQASIKPEDVMSLLPYENCNTIATLKVEPNTFDCSNLGDNQVTITATDASGNTTTSTATVTVNTATSVVPKFNSLSLDMTARGNGFTYTHDELFDINSVCSVELLECTLNGTPIESIDGKYEIELFCNEVGNNTVILKVKDAAGNIYTGSIQIYLNDLAKPQITKKDITINLNANGAASISPDDVTSDYSDNCGIETITVVPNTFDCSNVGANEVTITARDIYGNTSTAKAIVTINSGASVIAKANPLVLNMTENINSFTYTHDELFDITSNCNVALLGCTLNGESIIMANNAFVIDLSCAEVGSNEVILKVKDEAGNINTGKVQIELNDASKPQITKKDITISLDANGNASISPDDVTVDYFDNCGIQTITVVPNTFDCTNVGNNEVTITAIDVNSNTSTETATLTINPVTSVVAKVDPLVLNMTGRIESFTYTHEELFDITGHCSFELLECTLNGETIELANGQFEINLACSEVGSNEVILKVKDAAGNIVTGTVNITLNDLSAPQMTLRDLTISLDETGVVELSEDIFVEVYENCSIQDFSASPTTFDCSHVGDNEVTITATDANGNTTTETAIVTVTLNEPTLVSPKVNPLVLDMTGNINSFTYTHDELFDLKSICEVELLECSLNGSSINLENGLFQINLSCNEVGSNEVILKVKDAAGNILTSKVQIELSDVSKPQITVRDITVSLDENGLANYDWEDVVVDEFDNCAIVRRSTTPGSFDCTEMGENEAAVTFVDRSGNTTTETYTVTVIDEIAPIAICKDATVSLDESGSTLLTPEMIDGGSYDNCSINTYALDWDEFSCEDIGRQTVRLSVFDPSGLSRSCT
ncbi:MAG: hypothetical protein AAFO07_30580, partial [Bacteroidota bacterium]